MAIVTTVRDWERMLDNWGRWRGGASVSSALSSARLLMGVVARAENADRGGLVLNGEALDVEAAWVELEREDVRLARAVQVRYVWPEIGERQWAARCGVGLSAFYDRLQRGKTRMREHRDRLHNINAMRRAQARKALTAGGNCVESATLLAKLQPTQTRD